MKKSQVAILPSEQEGKLSQGQGLSSETLDEAVNRLRAFCESAQFLGYDPYDALRSPFLHIITRPSRWLRMAIIQVFRRNPVNLRPLVGIGKDYNPKGMGLFLKAYIRLAQLSDDRRFDEKIDFLADWLAQHRSPGYTNACWGYNFDWQSSVFYLPKGTPTIVNTVYIADAFLDLYDLRGEEHDLTLARSACDFILNDLHRFEEGDAFCFSYTPIDTLQVHNANMLGAALLARVFQVTKEDELREAVQRAIAYTLAHQRHDGSWPYGEGKGMNYVDSFHTGFVLESLSRIGVALKTTEYHQHLKKGLQFYRERFFLSNGTPKYYHNTLYPIDIHSASQAILTFSQLAAFDESCLQDAIRIAQWTIDNMQRPDGAFGYRLGRFSRNRIPYIRWGQAWMLLALASLQERINGQE